MGPEARAALALVEAGLPAVQVDRVMRMVGVESHDDSAAVTAKVEALTADLPNLFTPARTGGRPHLVPVVDDEAKDRAAERFEEMGRDALRSAGIRARPRGPGGDAA